MPQQRSPKGGISIHGTFYPGGEWIPSRVIDNLNELDAKRLAHGVDVGEPDKWTQDSHGELMEFNRANEGNPNKDINKRFSLVQAYDKARAEREKNHYAQERSEATANYVEAYFADWSDEDLEGQHEENRIDPRDYFESDEVQDKATATKDLIEMQKFAPNAIDGDTRQVIAEDLAEGLGDDNESWISILNSLSVQNSDINSDEAHFAIQAIQGSRIKPQAFDPKKRDYSFYSPNTPMSGEIVEGLKPIWSSPDGSISLVEGKIDSPFFADGSEAGSLDSQETLQKLFSHLGDPSIGEADIPASSRNVGRVSGDLGGSIDTSDFDANAVDVYRPLSVSYFVLRRGTANLDVDSGKKDTYELVHRSKLPGRSNLPEQYWQSLEAHDNGTVDDDKIEAIKNRKKAQAIDAKQRKEKKAVELTPREKLKQFDRQYGQLRADHNAVEGMGKRAEAHSNAMHSLYQELPFDGDSEEAYGDLESALDLATSTDVPDVPDFEVEQARKLMGIPSNRDEHREMIDDATSEAKDSYQSMRKDLVSSHKEFQEHFTELAKHWSSIINAARSYRDDLRSRGQDTRPADAVYVKATRMRRRIKG